MATFPLPSVARLANADVLSAFNIPSVKTVVAAMDAALARYAGSNDAVVEVPPSTLFFEVGGFGPDALFVVNLLRPGFAELCARLDDGTVASGAEFSRLFAGAARAKSAGEAVVDAEVFYRVDIGMLRAAADESATAKTEDASATRARRARP